VRAPPPSAPLARPGRRRRFKAPSPPPRSVAAPDPWRAGRPPRPCRAGRGGEDLRPAPKTHRLSSPPLSLRPLSARAHPCATFARHPWRAQEKQPINELSPPLPPPAKPNRTTGYSKILKPNDTKTHNPAGQQAPTGGRPPASRSAVRGPAPLAPASMPWPACRASGPARAGCAGPRRAVLLRCRQGSSRRGAAPGSAGGHPPEIGLTLSPQGMAAGADAGGPHPVDNSVDKSWKTCRKPPRATSPRLFSPTYPPFFHKLSTTFSLTYLYDSAILTLLNHTLSTENKGSTTTRVFTK